jgi:flavin reductase (DIM6/NTAB) family NADH-FMN oxidoreductase RutF
MTYFNKLEIEALEKNYRANLINSIGGYKSANLIATISEEGHTNVAVFSSVVHLGAHPALVGFIQRPIGNDSHTYHNIMQNGCYTINHIHQHFIEKAHFTSARFDANVSEFDACQLTAEFLEGFKAPFVGESNIKFGVRFVEAIPIALNNTILMIGEIEHIYIQTNCLLKDGNLQLNLAQDVTISGLETYHQVGEGTHFAYAKVSKLPNF